MEMEGIVTFDKVNDSGNYNDDFAFKIDGETIDLEYLLEQYKNKKIKLNIVEISPECVCCNCGKEEYKEKVYVENGKDYCYNCWEKLFLGDDKNE